MRRASLYFAMLCLIALCGVIGLAWFYSPDESPEPDGAQQQSTPAPKKPPLN
jgi:hypothetical protein